MRLGGSGSAVSGESRMVAADHQANVRVGGQAAIEHRQCVSHFLLQPVGENVRLQGLTQLLVVRLAAQSKVGWQIVVGIP